MNTKRPQVRGFGRCCAAAAWLAGTVMLALGSPLALGNELPSMDCVITPSRTLDLSTAVPGLVDRVTVDRSDTVEEGQVVALLVSKVEKAAVEIARARAAMTADIRLWEVSVVHDKRNRERLDSLHTRQAVADSDRDRADRDADLSRWKLQRARDTHLLNQLELARAQRVLEQKTIRSPIAGVVVERFKSSGEYVEDQPIVRIASLDPLYVETIMSMEHFGQIESGMVGEVILEGLPDDIHQATVTAVDRLGDAASGTFGVRLNLANPEYALPAGLKCKVRFLEGQRVAGVPSKPAAADRDGKPEMPSESQSVAATSQVPAAATSVALRQEPVAVKVTDTATKSNAVHQEPLNGTPVEAAAEICHSIGPLNDADKAEQLAAVLKSRGVNASAHPAALETPDRYIVASPKQDSKAALRALRASAASMGETDLYEMWDGPLAGRLSFGVYRYKSSAERRSRQLQGLGIEAETVRRVRSEWWLDLETALPKKRVTALVGRLVDSGSLSCRTRQG